jgi:UDP-glucuronate decarboxylase
MSLDDGRVVTNFIVQALRNEPLTVYGDGTQTRSFCFVSDLIDGLVSLFFATDIFEPINLGNPVPITMLDLAAEIIEITNSSSEIVFKPLPQDDPKDRQPDISKAKEKLRWEPIIERKEGISTTVKDVALQMRR